MDRCFSANEHEALALLLVQSQDLTGITADRLVSLYADAYKQIEEAIEKADDAPASQSI